MSCRGTYDVPHQGRNRIDRVTELCEVVASEPVTNSFAELGAGGAGKWRRPRCGWCRYRAPGASGPGSEALVQAVVDLVGAQLLGEGAHCGVLVDDGQLEVADLGEVLPGLQVHGVAHHGVVGGAGGQPALGRRSEEHTSELQSRGQLVCRLLLEKKKTVTL